jgi:hypothetical protein
MLIGPVFYSVERRKSLWLEELNEVLVVAEAVKAV